MTITDEIKAEVAEYQAKYLRPWMVVGQLVKHRTRDVLGTIAFVTRFTVGISRLEVQEDIHSEEGKDLGLLDMVPVYRASLIEAALCWEPYERPEAGSRFDKLARRDVTLV